MDLELSKCWKVKPFCRQCERRGDKPNLVLNGKRILEEDKNNFSTYTTHFYLSERKNSASADGLTQVITASPRLKWSELLYSPGRGTVRGLTTTQRRSLSIMHGHRTMPHPGHREEIRMTVVFVYFL